MVLLAWTAANGALGQSTTVTPVTPIVPVTGVAAVVNTHVITIQSVDQFASRAV